MFKKILNLIVLVSFMFLVSGCALISTAISAGIGYGIYQATKK
jgi:uncharacterized protein YceK